MREYHSRCSITTGTLEGIIPSQHSTELVLSALRAASEPLESHDIKRLTGLSINTVRLVLSELRARRTIRQETVYRRYDSVADCRAITSHTCKYRIATPKPPTPINLIRRLLKTALIALPEKYSQGRAGLAPSGESTAGHARSAGAYELLCTYTVHGTMDDILQTAPYITPGALDYPELFRLSAALVLSLCRLGGNHTGIAILHRHLKTEDDLLFLPYLQITPDAPDVDLTKLTLAIRQQVEGASLHPDVVKQESRRWRQVRKSPGRKLQRLVAWMRHSGYVEEAVFVEQRGGRWLSSNEAAPILAPFTHERFKEIRRDHWHGGVSPDLAKQLLASLLSNSSLPHQLAGVYALLREPDAKGDASHSDQLLNRLLQQYGSTFDLLVAKVDLALHLYRIRRVPEATASKVSHRKAQRKEQSLLRELDLAFQKLCRHKDCKAEEETLLRINERYRAVRGQSGYPLPTRSAVDKKLKPLKISPLNPRQHKVTDEIRQALIAHGHLQAVSLLLRYYPKPWIPPALKDTPLLLALAFECSDLDFADRILAHFGRFLGPAAARRMRDQIHERRDPHARGPSLIHTSRVLTEIGTRRPVNKKAAAGTVGSPYTSEELAAYKKRHNN